ncbi:sensor histidine kinase [Sporolactobacillus pectinivorans]|uniref:sensor histidine kinase n=1 Tax=Sporolactobacillus pectinivorans TaxID=1591408 RepID=UPI000C265ADD|nr:HAMP domain-containing sensor histidine kinase [Sporolactobacillus pectinivorans]
MTIKKRLFISNIMMIIIPSVVTIVVFSICAMIFRMMFQETPNLNQVGIDAHEVRDASMNALIALLAFLVLVGFVTVMYFTNRFLTKFVFKKIEQPLEMLSDGVHQVSDGNLDYRLTYQQNDEFKPVCEGFNNMAARLKDSIEEVQKNERNRKELLSSISHDLRSPLTSIKAFVEGLLDGVATTPTSQREYLEIIKQKTDDINSMVSQLLWYSKMDMGNYPMSPEKLDIGRELSDFVTASKEEYKAKGLMVHAGDMFAFANKYIYADPAQLRSVFANILDNSAKYKNKDAANTSIHCAAKNGVIHIVFEDDGPGVPEDSLPNLFDVFYRGDFSRSNPRQGSGLGLAIVAKAVERMNGTIYAKNRKEGGLCMVIEIPEMRNAR